MSRVPWAKGFKYAISSHGGFLLVSLRESRKRGSQHFNLDVVISDYLSWLESIFYVLVSRFNYQSGEQEYGGFRSPKRGDQLYSDRVMLKFKWLRQRLGDIIFFDRRIRDGWVESPCLHIVLEYNANRYHLRESYDLCGVDFNRWMTYLRRHFGRVSIIRCFEAHDSGYVHIHLMALFEDHVFEGKPMMNKKGKRIFRVVGKDFNILKKGWKSGYTDFQMVDSAKGGVYYLSKYLSKSVSVEEAGEKGIKGLAMCWFTRKRSFSVSGKFIRAYADVIHTNSNSTEDKEISVFVGYDLIGERILHRFTKWKLLGFMLSDHVIWKSGFRYLDRKDFEESESMSHYESLYADEVRKTYIWVGDRIPELHADQEKLFK